MFRWFRNRRRREIMKRPFPAEWEKWVRGSVKHYLVLDDAERDILRDAMKVFIAEKQWEGCGGLALTDEIRVIIAAQACLLLIGLEHDYYRNVESILVYPSTVVTPEPRIGVFEHAVAPVETAMPILGQAFTAGPVILVWDAVLRDARHPEHGHNVVFHEFAHKLDMLDGVADGTPPLVSRDRLDRWVEVCTREYQRLRRGSGSFLDSYAGTNEAEFFAVATEVFFDRPLDLQRHSPDLYRLLGEYYGQDPAARVRRARRRKGR